MTGKITDPARLAVLEKARQKAKENRERRKAEKEAEKQMEKKEISEDVSLKIESKNDEKSESKGMDLCKSEEIPKSEPQPQVVVVKQPKKTKKKQVIYVDESSSEDEPIVIRRRGKNKTKTVMYDDDLDQKVHGGERKFVNPKNQSNVTANLATPSDKQELPPPPLLQRSEPYSFQVSNIMSKYYPN